MGQWLLDANYAELDANGISKTAKYVQYGGWVGTAVGAGVLGGKIGEGLGDMIYKAQK